MFKFIGKALAGLVLTKKARTAVGRRASAAGKAKPPAVAEVQARARDVVTPERAELIRHALQVRAAKQTILADLDDETRAKLVATAMKALLNEGRDKT